MTVQAGADVTDGERKTVTALFADLKGSMELLQELDPEEARALVDPALTLMIEAVRRYDGYTVQSTGDGIFALFGAPVSHEDDPQRALYTALRIQAEMRRYAARLREAGNLPVEARVGVNTGEVVVRSLATGDGHAEYTPIGHSTGLAARLQAIAPTGGIATSDTTRKLCEGYFTFRALGPTRIRGVAERVNIFEVTGHGTLRTQFEAAAQRGLTRFVGRHHEIEALKHAFELVRAGHGQIVAVLAEAGVGKSRLFFELKSVSQLDCMVMEAFSVSHGKATAYLPVIELLHGYFGTETTDDGRKRREKVTGRVVALDPALQNTLPYLFDLLGILNGEDPLAQMNPQIKQRRTLEAIKRILIRESLKQPLMVIFEDLHWIDAQTQELLNLLADSIGTAKILLLVNYRPEYAHQWTSKTYYTQLRLDRLGGESAEQMLDGLLSGPDTQSGLGLPAPESAELSALKRLIVRKTEGTPFFMEEMVQALFDDGTLQRDRMGVKLARPLTQIRVPATVQAVLASRIDRLAAEEKELLHTLAVLGREFLFELVQRVTNQPRDSLEARLSRLQSAEFIYEHPAPGDLAFTFKHALTQEVAYNSMLNERRRQLHERAGQALESIFAGHLGDYLSDLAHHYSRSANLSKAVEYLHLAGQQAARQSANPEAIALLNHAIELLQMLPDSPERAKQEIALQISLGAPLIINAGFSSPEVERAYSRALELCKQTGSSTELPLVLYGLWQGTGSRPDFRQQRKVAKQILTLAEENKDPALCLLAAFTMGYTLYWLGDFSAALAHAERGLAAYDPQQHHSLAYIYGQDLGVACQVPASWALCSLGFPDQALKGAEKAVALARECTHPFSLAASLTVLTVVHLYRSEPAATQAAAEEVIALCAEYGFPFFLAWGILLRGCALADQGHRDEGVLEMRRGLTACRATGSRISESRWLALQALVMAQTGHPQAAIDLLDEAFKYVDEAGEGFYQSELHRLKGEITLKYLAGARRSGMGEAEANFRHAIEIARKQRAKLWELRATTSLARLLLQQDHRDEARTMLGAIYDWFTEGFDTADLKEAKALLNELSC